jgi:LPXTG-site transpeptidase (sortase) family protein
MKVRSWAEFFETILFRKVSFLLAFFVTFLITYATLVWFDFIPETVKKYDVVVEVIETIEEEPSTENILVSEEIEDVIGPAILPLVIKIEPLNKTISIANPTSRKVSDLDTALLSGAVRHPDSATLDQLGTVFILGHSSYLPSVRNKNFQAFNGIQDLKWGDTIKITAVEGEYTYRVDKVYRAVAQDVVVPIAGSTKRLILATCNSFGSVNDRFIVEADLIETNLYKKK